MSPPDRAAAALALRQFLLALGVPVDSEVELQGTPERAAGAFCDELLDGYRHDPAEVLADALPTREDAMVAVTNIQYVSVCPHHLMPASGVAHVGYLPAGRIVGLGVLVQLVDALSHRLVLQESLGRQIAESLHTKLGASAVGVVLEARHACLSMRGEKQSDAVVVTQAFEGQWAGDAVARAEFLQCVTRTARKG